MKILSPVPQMICIQYLLEQNTKLVMRIYNAAVILENLRQLQIKPSWEIGFLRLKLINLDQIQAHQLIFVDKDASVSSLDEVGGSRLP